MTIFKVLDCSRVDVCNVLKKIIVFTVGLVIGIVLPITLGWLTRPLLFTKFPEGNDFSYYVYSTFISYLIGMLALVLIAICLEFLYLLIHTIMVRSENIWYKSLPDCENPAELDQLVNN